jgi:RNA polymerase sigma factor (sigma-70 family)
MMSDDMTLVREFAANQSEPAFAALVERHIALVHSAALRQVGDMHLAEEITQAVFIILARKAASLGTKTILSAWLYRTTRYAAADALRARRRRQAREQEAHMQSILNQPDTDAWAQLAPLLDDALAELGETDRTALVLRFFENKTTREIAGALRMEEAAAQKRVVRALEKLRAVFVKRGVTLTATVIAGAVAANSVQAAPAGLAVKVSVVAAKGAAVTTSITTIVKGALKIMTYAKLKLALGLTAGILLAGGATTLVISQTNTDDKWTPQEIAKQAQDAYAALSSYSDTGTAVSEGGGQTQTTTFNIRLQRPNLYRIDWTGTGGLYTSKGVAWSDGNGDFLVTGAAGQEKSEKPVKKHDMQFTLGAAGALSGSAASEIPGTFFNQRGGDTLSLAALGRSQLQQERDEKVGAVDCCVISSVIDPAKLPNKGKLPNNTGKVGTITTTLWIGKQDHLIHQIRTVMEGATIALPQESDSNLKTILERQNKPVTPEAIAALRAELEKSMKLAQSALNSGKFVFTQTHENIVVNQKFSPADFAR